AKDDPYVSGEPPQEPCYPKPQDNAMKNKFQQPRGRTDIGFGYDALLIVPAAGSSSSPAASTLYGTQFYNGRIDVFSLSNGLLPMKGEAPPQKTRLKTPDDLKTSPVRFVADDATLYVAAGSLDRVQAYRIRKEDGMLKTVAGERHTAEPPFSVTDEQDGSFPNDVAVATLSGDCR
ncbi:MAG: hypothetical protein ACREQL_09300, partial [Candidatus Binatia bacterium]